MSFYQGPATSILHPTDFSATSIAAFDHALAIALENQADLTVLHVVSDENEDVPWHDFPSVRGTLERWGKLQPGSRRSDVADRLGVHVKKMYGVGKDVAETIVSLAERDSFDLMVMATSENRQHPFWPKAHISLPVSQRLHLPTLFVPTDVRGSVAEDAGTTALERVLIAVDHQPDVQPAIARIFWAMEKFGGKHAEVTLLHVGSEGNFPTVELPSGHDIEWKKMTRSGSAANEIVQAAEELTADLIVLVTEGKRGFWDVLVGSTTQHVLHKTPCLVFAMPA